MLDEQPFAVANANQHPGATELLAMQSEFQFPSGKGFGNIIRTLGCVSPAVPNHHGAGAILAWRNHALKISVCQGMILHRERQAFDRRVEGWTFWHRP